MSTSDIIAEISKLSREDLCAIAVKVDQTLRKQGAIVYDDAYGVFTEADQAALASEAWATAGQAEVDHSEMDGLLHHPGGKKEP